MQNRIKKLSGLLKKYCSNTEGATALEYALLTAVLSVSLIAAFSLIASNQSSMWSDLGNTFSASN